MNILVGQIRDDKTLDKIDYLKKFDKSINLIKVYNAEDGLKYYNSNDIDIVIIDFEYECFQELMDGILSINKYQKTITISNEIKCNDNNGCKDCIENFNRKRLLDEFSIKELINIVNHFDTEQCKYYKSFDNIATIAEDILKRFSGYKYNKETMTITLNDNANSIRTLLDIINILNQHNIPYEVKDTTIIQIKK